MIEFIATADSRQRWRAKEQHLPELREKAELEIESGVQNSHLSNVSRRLYCDRLQSNFLLFALSLLFRKPVLFLQAKVGRNPSSINNGRHKTLNFWSSRGRIPELPIVLCF
jgi:hypothetical protein